MNLEIPNSNLSIHVRGKDFIHSKCGPRFFFIDESNEKNKDIFS